MKAAEAKAKGINPILIKNKVFLQDWDSEKFGLTEQVGACPVPPPLVPGPPEPLLCWAALVASPNTGAFFRTPQETIKFQEIYAMADSQNNGYLGRRQFTDLLKLLSIVVEGVRLRRAPSRPAAPLIYLAYSPTKTGAALEDVRRYGRERRRADRVRRCVLHNPATLPDLHALSDRPLPGLWQKTCGSKPLIDRRRGFPSQSSSLPWPAL